MLSCSAAFSTATPPRRCTSSKSTCRNRRKRLFPTIAAHEKRARNGCKGARHARTDDLRGAVCRGRFSPDGNRQGASSVAWKYARSVPVSYTHLRAHETGRNLVCRLLLEKKKNLKKNTKKKTNSSPQNRYLTPTSAT